MTDTEVITRELADKMTMLGLETALKVVKLSVNFGHPPLRIIEDLENFIAIQKETDAKD